MDEVWQQIPWPQIWLSIIGGFLGGGMTLAVLDVRGLWEAFKRLFCSLAWATGGTQMILAAAAWFKPGIHESMVIAFGVAFFCGVTGWYVGHWIVNYLEMTKTKTIWQVAGDVTHKTERIKKGRP